MKFTDVLKNILDYTFSHFPEVITAISSFGLFILTWFIFRYAKKAFHANTISNSRPPYIGTLRKALSELHGALLDFVLEENQEEKKKLFTIINSKMSIVIYHFNEFEQMNIDRKFIEFLQKNIDFDKINESFIEQYRRYASAILQYEWDNFKKEVEKGQRLEFDEKEDTKRLTIDRVID